LPNHGDYELGNYEVDLRRIEADVLEIEKIAFVEPVKSEVATRYVYRLYARASLNGNLKELRQLEQLIDHAIECLGPAEDLCLLKANLDFKLHRLNETKRDLNLAPALAARRQGRTILADIAFQEGRYTEARAALEQLAEEDPTWDVLARIAHIEGKMGDADEADRLYLEAEEEITAKEMRSFAWVELQRGLLDLSRGRQDDAIRHYEVADRAYTGYWLTTEHLGDALNSGDHYERVLAAVDKPEVAQKLGQTLARDGHYDKAKEFFARALHGYLESAEQGEVHYYHHLTEYFADVASDGAEALKWARRDIALRDNFNTQTALAWALHCGGQSTAAVPYIERALASGVRDSNIFNKAAKIFEAAGHHTQAHSWEHRAADLNPSCGAVHIH
jgi:tetratricopeptide (TPR) repeat protein